MLRAIKAYVPFKEYVAAVRRKTGIQIDNQGREDTEIFFLTYCSKNVPWPTIYDVGMDPQVLTDVWYFYCALLHHTC